jgi:hypothetical protein
MLTELQFESSAWSQGDLVSDCEYALKKAHEERFLWNFRTVDLGSTS